jgi:eukaryotic-like serine/threonine-protein kinase
MVLRCGSVEIDEKTREIRRDRRVVHTEPKVFDLLFYLIRRRDRVVSKQELLDAIWAGAAVGDAALTRCVSLARKALGDPRLIAVVHGRGYRFVDTEPKQLGPRELPPSTSLSNGGSPNVTTSSFVGREQSLARAEERLVLVEQGRGGVCFVYGEAGIGKSRFLLELATRVSARDGLVLRGESPDADGAPAFWPWLQILRKLAQVSGDPGYRAELGASAAELLGVIRSASMDGGEATGSSPQNRFLFFEQIAETFGRIAEARPLTLLFDDLHQTDLPSLQLFTYLARVCVDRRILLVGTYRDRDLAADEERTAALAPAWRAQALSFELRGLSVDDVAELIAARLKGSSLEDLAESLHAKTGGNPFFLTQLIPLIEQEALPVSEIELPRGVRGVIRRQVRGLGSDCSDVLAAAAIFGARFEASWLTVTGYPIAAVLHGLQQAVTANLLRQSLDFPGRFEFVHGLVRDVLYEDLDVERRMALHQHAAGLFEAHPGLDEELRLAALVHHLGRALPLGSTEKALNYTVRAATHALSRYAYETACDYFERALVLLETGAVGDEATLFSVLLDLGHAQAQAGRRDVARTTFDRAAELSRRAGFSDGLARVALRLGAGVAGNELMFAADSQQIALLRDALDALGSNQPRVAALLQARLAAALYVSTDWENRNKLFQRAEELAGRDRDDSFMAELTYARLCSLWRPENLDQRVLWADEAQALLEQARNFEHLASLQLFRFAIGLERGDAARAKTAVAAFRRASIELHYPSSYGDGLDAVMLLLEGKLAEAEERCTAMLRIAERMQLSSSLQAFGALSTMIRIERGQSNEVIEGLRQFEENFRDVPGWRVLLAFALAKAGRFADATVEFGHLAERGFPIPRDTTWLGCMAMLSVVCSKLRDGQQAAILYDSLTPFADRHAVAGAIAFSLGSMHRFLGLLSVARRDPHSAGLHFEGAIASNTNFGAPLFVAYAQHEYAALLRLDGPCHDAKRAEVLEKLALKTANSCGAIQLQREIAESSGLAR